MLYCTDVFTIGEWQLEPMQPPTPPLGLRHVCGTGRQPTLKVPRCDSTQGEVIVEGDAVRVGVGINATPASMTTRGTTPCARCNNRAIVHEELAIEVVVGALLP